MVGVPCSIHRQYHPFAKHKAMRLGARFGRDALVQSFHLRVSHKINTQTVFFSSRKVAIQTWAWICCSCDKSISVVGLSVWPGWHPKVFALGLQVLQGEKGPFIRFFNRSGLLKR